MSEKSPEDNGSVNINLDYFFFSIIYCKKVLLVRSSYYGSGLVCIKSGFGYDLTSKSSTDPDPDLTETRQGCRAGSRLDTDTGGVVKVEKCALRSEILF